jgi:hypothetical protein
MGHSQFEWLSRGSCRPPMAAISLSRSAVAYPAECLDGCLVGVGQGVQVALGRHDRGVAEAFLRDLQVGPAGEQP